MKKVSAKYHNSLHSRLIFLIFAFRFVNNRVNARCTEHF